MADEKTRDVKKRNARRKRQKERRLRRRRQIMAVLAIALLILILLIIGIVRLVKGSSGHVPTADATTLTLLSDGRVVYEEVLSVDDGVTEKMLRSFIKDEIRDYNETSGAQAVLLDEVSVNDGVAYQKTTYKDAVCYSDFTGYELYSGLIRDASQSGYDFETKFASVHDGILGEEVTKDFAMADTGLSVLIIRENGLVRVPGDIKYLSINGVRLSDSDMAEVYPVDGNEDAAVLAYIIYDREGQ